MVPERVQTDPGGRSHRRGRTRRSGHPNGNPGDQPRDHARGPAGITVRTCRSIGQSEVRGQIAGGLVTARQRRILGHGLDRLKPEQPQFGPQSSSLVVSVIGPGQPNAFDVVFSLCIKGLHAEGGCPGYLMRGITCNDLVGKDRAVIGVDQCPGGTGLGERETKYETHVATPRRRQQVSALSAGRGRMLRTPQSRFSSGLPNIRGLEGLEPPQPRAAASALLKVSLGRITAVVLSRSRQ